MLAHFILGIVQGLTEFLPISSSGHLVLASRLFGLEGVDPAFDVFVQGGTVISVLFYFRHRLLHLSRQYLKFIIIASIPAAIFGLLLSDYIDALFSSLWGVVFGFTLTTIVILFSRRPPLTKSKSLNTKSSFMIGLSQALAILPGLSRSGTTITTSLLLRIRPEDAFSFSFLLSIPTIAGASLLSLRSLTWDPAMATNYLVGFFTATITGYYSLILVSRLVKRGQFYLFAPYTAILATLSFYLALS